MAIGSEIYAFYANKSPINVEEEFIRQLKKKWQNPVIEEIKRNERHLEFFFAKAVQMNAPTTAMNESNEGSFKLSVRKFEHFEAKAQVLGITFPKELERIEEYNTCFFLENVWEYTLVLPSLITESTFSNDLYFILQSILECK